MEFSCRWQENMKFKGLSSEHEILMDAKKPIGGGTAMNPKELVVAGVCGCTAMDLVGLMKKHKQTVDNLEIKADVEMSDGGHPHVFKKINLLFKLQGPIDASLLLESIRLSQTKYCGVSAMLSKAVPISYRVELNGEEIGEGKADFKEL